MRRAGGRATATVAVTAAALLAAFCLGTAREILPAAIALLIAGCADAARPTARSTDPDIVRRARAAVANLPAAVAAVTVALIAAREAAIGIRAGASVVALIIATGAAALHVLSIVIDRERRPPVLTRNVRLDMSVPSRPAPVWLRAGVPAPSLAAFALLPHEDAAAAAVLLTLAFAAALAGTTRLGVHVVRLRRQQIRARITSAATAAMAALEPHVLLYFASTPEEHYQVDMWLGPVEQLGIPAAVVVRDHEVLAKIGMTSLPVFSVVPNGTLAALPLPKRVVGLFVTHSGNNLALLRRPEVQSVFVGHGDSDKPDSANPFARVYDEVWVAGPAGRARYARAGVGVRDDCIAEIGRPQHQADWGAAPEIFTVLYAPTWEGWGDDQHHTSLPHVGVALVRRLIDAGVRVIYRPHPLTGVRNDSVRQADREIRRLLEATGARRVGAADLPAANLTPSDPLDAAVESSRHHTLSRLEWEQAMDSAAAALFAGNPGRSSIVVEDPPTLAQTFRAASALITDVSSVASDWLLTGRPYAMVDTRGLGPKEFRRRFAAAADAIVLDPTLAQLDQILASDVKSLTPPASRRSRRPSPPSAVLGPADPQAAFRDAVLRLLDRPGGAAPTQSASTRPRRTTGR